MNVIKVKFQLRRNSIDQILLKVLSSLKRKMQIRCCHYVAPLLLKNYISHTKSKPFILSLIVTSLKSHP